MENIIVAKHTKAKHSRLKEVDFTSLSFGQHVSDHMLVCDYAFGEWNIPEIIPYGEISMNPSALALHYGQTVFEGMKAFSMQDGSSNIFRIFKHYERFERSLERMCMAVPPKELFVEGLAQLVELDRNWIPNSDMGSLYLRPFMYASEEKFGLKVSEKFRFIIFTGPVGNLYSKPIRVKVESEFTRAARGGTGYAKCGGNYGGSFYPTRRAQEDGYDQVLWTDGEEHQYIEESGMMNAMFVIEEKLITPPISDSILDGVTRDSLLTIARSEGVEVQERPVSLKELELAFNNGTITEAFGAGTAAVVAPIGTIHINGVDYDLPRYSHENLMNRLKNKLNDIRTGKSEDIYGWNFVF